MNNALLSKQPHHTQPSPYPNAADKSTASPPVKSQESLKLGEGKKKKKKFSVIFWDPEQISVGQQVPKKWQVMTWGELNKFVGYEDFVYQDKPYYDFLLWETDTEGKYKIRTRRERPVNVQTILKDYENNPYSFFLNEDEGPGLYISPSSSEKIQLKAQSLNTEEILDMQLVTGNNWYLNFRKNGDPITLVNPSRGCGQPAGSLPCPKLRVQPYILFFETDLVDKEVYKSEPQLEVKLTRLKVVL